MSESNEGKTGRILWGVGTSRTIRPHWALHELGLTYEVKPIGPRSGETLTQEYTALTARQKIPLLQDQGLVMTESAAIIAYLSDAYANESNRLVPTDARQRASCLEWCFFIISELDATSLYVMRRRQDLSEIYGESPTANKAAADYFQKQMRTVERALSDGRAFIFGNRFGAADILLSSCLTWAVRYQIPLSDLALAYNRTLTARDAYQKALQRNTPVHKA